MTKLARKGCSMSEQSVAEKRLQHRLDKATSLVQNAGVSLLLVLIVVVNSLVALWNGKRWAGVIISLLVCIRK